MSRRPKFAVRFRWPGGGLVELDEAALPPAARAPSKTALQPKRPWSMLAVATGLAVTSLAAVAQSALPTMASAELERARIPTDALAVLVVPVEPRGAPRLAWRVDAPVNPASVMKLVTTFAALDLLGPAYTWRTGVYLDGTLKDGVLRGNLYIRGGADPKLVAERLWLLLRRVQGLGIAKIQGDIVLDASAFSVPPADAASFDNEPLRPYNAAPDALLVNFKAVAMNFVPDASVNVARVHYEPPLSGIELPATVPLKPGDCRDWRAGLRADFGDAARIRFDGGFPAACGEKFWAVALADPARHAERAIGGMWRAIGGGLSGKVRLAKVPPALTPAFEIESPPLSDVIRDINKYSNNVMARQVFLTLSLQRDGVGTIAGSRDVIQRWWAGRFPAAPAPIIDNGAGLSRDARLTAGALGRMLQAAFASPWMPEFISSLPIQGVDGTLKKRSGAAGAAHLKGGSLRDVSGVAGYVEGLSGRRYVLVAVLNDPNAAGARGALEALVEWTRSDLAPAAVTR